MSKDIFLTNNLTNKKEKFVPLDKNNIRMYVCGPTVYDDPHIGNARPIVVFDILFKIFKKNYPKVTYVRNITDVDDKIIKSSKENNISISELTSKVTESFSKDCHYLNCEEPTHQPKATENIDLMIEMISELIKKEFAYENNKHVYFEVKKFKDYGQLSNKKLDELIAGSRVEVSENKKNSEDFVLWKPSEDDEPSWESPWGKGRPGWHLECSAMSKKFLGDEFDVHGGGIDLLFPHHENEIAQSRCANDTKIFAKFWMHNAFITMSNEKMAKSQGNILKIKDFRNKISGQVLRLALLSAHYKQPLDWNDKLLDDCQNTINKWYNSYLDIENNSKVSDEILQPLYDDLNTPGYIANLHQLYDKAQKGNNEDKSLFVSACQFVGLLKESKENWLKFKISKALISEKEILQKIQERNKARENKNYEEADKIRNDLLDKGVLIEDKDGKTTWKFK
ncbi:cysteine--tRNA ligase [Candidatus Pelagibacter communis]|uniref:cysteine--tRNA ligase n=1 Tax=Pelagibacter ubique TaxID=198252 RepID=UPI00094D55BE|nr:cysteine--tRNA ligase [Candidatus Pelagibacter ubique]